MTPRLRTVALCHKSAADAMRRWHNERAEEVATAAWSWCDALRQLSPEELRLNRAALIEAREFLEQAYAAAYPVETDYG
jgi:hypothetical protein